MRYGDLDKETLVALLSLPDHLRESALAVIRLKRAAGTRVARRTGRARAIESSYLNQLVRMGYLERERVSHDVYFKVGDKLKGAA